VLFSYSCMMSPRCSKRSLSTTPRYNTVIMYPISSFPELIPPSYQDPEDDGSKPEQTLKCDWVYPCGFMFILIRPHIIIHLINKARHKALLSVKVRQRSLYKTEHLLILTYLIEYISTLGFE